MFKVFELFSFQYTEFIESGKNDQVHVFVVINKISKITNFTSNYLKNYNNSERAAKTKNAPFFMNFLNIYKIWQLFPTENAIFVTFHFNSQAFPESVTAPNCINLVVVGDLAGGGLVALPTALIQSGKNSRAYK